MITQKPQDPNDKSADDKMNMRLFSVNPPHEKTMDIQFGRHPWNFTMVAQDLRKTEDRIDIVFAQCKSDTAKNPCDLYSIPLAGGTCLYREILLDEGSRIITVKVVPSKQVLCVV